MAIDRLRADFRMQVLLTFALVTTLGLLPFAAYRFTNGDHWIGLFDLAVVAAIVFGSAHAWRTGRTQGASLFMAIVYSLSCMLIAQFNGLAGLLWVFPVVLANFLLIERSPAILLSAVLVLGVVLGNDALVDLAHQWMFAITAAVTCVFSHVFARRASAQREQLEAIASRDPLTGAGNRRALVSGIEAAVSAQGRGGGGLGLLVLDLDHFKAINDNHGHEAGDDVLVQLAVLARECVRRGDQLYRLGGEEFCLLVPEPGVDGLALIGEKLRAMVAARVRCGDQAVTVSVGGAMLRPGETASQWQARADAAMYRAKHAGRNRCIVDGDGGASAAPGASPGAAMGGPAIGRPS